MEAKLKFVKLHRDQFFDDGRIRVVERYKDSALSGDEWRFSCVVELSRKGRVIARRSVGGDMTVAATQLLWGLQVGPQELEEDPHWEVEKAPRGHYADDGKCCQRGCPKEGVHVYVLKQVQLARHDGRLIPNEPEYEGGAVQARRFCERHKRRGDCGLDDADANYVKQ